MNTKKNIDETLVEAYKAGSNKALATLVKRWHKLFCDKAYWMVKDKEAAKDIAQDSWTIIIKKIEHLKDPKQFKYWSYRIVCNKAMDWLRLKSKNQKQTMQYAVQFESDEKEYSENDLLKIRLLKAIELLPAHQKTIVRLFYTEAYSLKQICYLLDISIGTAKSRLFHAREKLKKELNTKQNKY